MQVNVNDLFQMIGQQQVENTMLKQQLAQATAAVQKMGQQLAAAENKPEPANGQAEPVPTRF